MNPPPRRTLSIPWLVALLMSMALSCASASPLPDRDRDLAHSMVADGAVLLDVRTASEFADGHVDGATSIPVEELAERLAEIDAMTQGDKDHGIVVYCRSGKRAGQAKELLVQHGYTRVTNFGGYKDW